MHYTARIDDKEYIFEEEEILHMDLIPLKDSKFHLLDDKVSYIASILHIDQDSKCVTVNINNREIKVKIETILEQLIDKMGMTAVADNGQKEIMAPMPGLILEILVKAGDEVKKDQDLVILEAMKMENILKAEADGSVEELLVSKGNSVDKHQVLIKLN